MFTSSFSPRFYETDEYVQAIEPCEGFMVSWQRFAQIVERTP